MRFGDTASVHPSTYFPPDIVMPIKIGEKSSARSCQDEVDEASRVDLRVTMCLKTCSILVDDVVPHITFDAVAQAILEGIHNDEVMRAGIYTIRLRREMISNLLTNRSGHEMIRTLLGSISSDVVEKESSTPDTRLTVLAKLAEGILECVHGEAITLETVSKIFDNIMRMDTECVVFKVDAMDSIIGAALSGDFTPCLLVRMLMSSISRQHGATLPICSAGPS